MAKNSAIRTFVLQMAKAVIAALTVVLVSRWMGAEGRGELGVLLFYVNLFMVVNEYVGGSNLGNMAAKYSLQKLLPISWSWALVTLFFGGLMLFFWTGDKHTAFYVVLMAFPLAFLTIQYNVYQGRSEVYRRNILQLVLEILKLFFIILLGVFAQQLIVLGPQPSLFGTFQFLHPQDVVVAYTAATAIVLILSIIIWLPKIARAVPHFAIQKPPVGFISQGFWAQNGQLVQFLNYRFSLLLLVWLLGSAAPSGIYANALLLADTIWIFGNSFGTIAHMRMLQSENKKFQADITLRYAFISIIGTSAAVAIMALVPNGVFVSVFGSDFQELKTTVLWLIPAILALGASTLFSHYLHANNEFKKLLLANLSGLILQVILALLFIPVMGLKGACIAADAGFLLILGIVVFLFKKQNPNAKFHGAIRFKSILRLLWN